MKYLYLLECWKWVGMVAAIARVSIAELNLHPRWIENGHDGYHQLVPRTNKRTQTAVKKRGKTEKVQVQVSPTSRSQHHPSYTDPGASSSYATSAATLRALSNMEPETLRHGRAALLAAVGAMPQPREKSRSPSPTSSRVSGHPLSAMALARGPVTLDTNRNGPSPPRKITVDAGDEHFVNVRGPVGVAVGANVHEGGSVVAGTTGDISVATVDARKGGKGWLHQQMPEGEGIKHNIQPGDQIESPNYAKDPSTGNVGSLATMEGKGQIRLGAAEAMSQPKPLPGARPGEPLFKKYGERPI